MIELPDELEMNLNGLMSIHCGGTANGILHAIIHIMRYLNILYRLTKL
jgi:hypothetical protein